MPSLNWWEAGITTAVQEGAFSSLYDNPELSLETGTSFPLPQQYEGVIKYIYIIAEDWRVMRQTRL